MLRFENTILRMIAEGVSLTETADSICCEVEAALPNSMCSIISVDRAGMMHSVAAPRLPAEFNAAIDGLMIGPEVGACGTAAYLRLPVLIEDIRNDPRCSRAAGLLAKESVRACWSLPLFAPDGQLIGVSSLYFRSCRGPDEDEQQVMSTCAELCEMALQRHQRMTDRERRATVDALTGLPNRLAFEQAIGRMPYDVDGAWALLMVDLDNLKVVNDTFGHLTGDALIRAAASRLAKAVAPDVTFRLGGDEFAVIVQDTEALADLATAASRIFAALDTPARCEGHVIVPRATIGGAVVGGSENSSTAVSEAADFALYHAKETGRGGFVRYWPGIDSRMFHRRAAIRDVAAALADQRIDAYYQPVIRLDTREIVGVEALCRMTTLSGTVVAAKDFQEATSDAHVATALTERMLSIVTRDVRRWLAEGIPFQHVGINVAAADFHAGDLLQKIERAVAAAGISLAHIILEVNENVCIGHRDKVVAREIEQLRRRGVRVALDGFGTGFASLTHLLNVPVDVIKVDRSFIARLWPEDPSTVVVQALIDIAHKLEIRVVAEGIETEVQSAQLWTMRCSLGQGFGFSAAVDRSEMTLLLRRHAQGGEGVVPLYRAQSEPLLSTDDDTVVRSVA